MKIEPASKLHEIVINAHDIAPTTRATYLRDLNQWIEFAGAEPAGWTRRRAADFYTALLARMKPQSANRLMASVAYASRWWAHYEHDPALDFGTVQNAKAKDKKPQHALDEPAARQLLNTCDGSPRGLRDFALIVVGLETGMRRISLTGMMLEDTAPVGRRWPYPATFVPLKGKDPAWVPLSDTALLALQPWLAFLSGHNQLEGPMFRPIGRYVTPDSKLLSPSMFAKIFRERAKAAGLRHINPHLLRHTFITWREAQGLVPHEIASITHHDLAKALGALGGYMDAREIGGRVRNRTPEWLVELVQHRVLGSATS